MGFLTCLITLPLPTQARQFEVTEAPAEELKENIGDEQVDLDVKYQNTPYFEAAQLYAVLFKRHAPQQRVVGIMQDSLLAVYSLILCRE